MNDSLKTLGLTTYENKIYISLLEYGQMNAKQISEKSHVPPTAVYPNLKSLLKKGLIQQFEADIKLFKAIKPSVALPEFISRKKKEFCSIENELIPQLENISKKKQYPPEKEVLDISAGRKASIVTYYKGFCEAKKTIYIMGWRLRKVKDKYTILQKLKKAIKRNVEIRILLLGKSDKAWELVKAYQNAGIKIKYTPTKGENFTMLIIDEKECKISLKKKTFPERYNIHVYDSSLIDAFMNYFEDSWKRAQDVDTKKYLK